MTQLPRTPVEPPHADVDYLGDFLDGILPADARDALDEHLALCSACRARLGALRLLVERAAHAPIGIEPADDLWPGIHAAIESRRTLALPVGNGTRAAESPRRWRIVALVVAASAAIAATSAIVTMRIVHTMPARSVAERPVSPPPSPPNADSDALLRYVALERDYDRSARQLWAALDAARGTLAPETVATVERSVATIDRAIAEARDALQRDPGNRVLLDMLTATHQQKLDLLRRAAQRSEGA
jgi:hypothetical protein